MEQILSSLRQLVSSLDKINMDINKEGQVYQAELEDRLAKGLTGDAAIGHYNEWMEAAGMSYLKVEI